MNVLYNVIVHQVGHLSRVILGCTVSKTEKKLFSSITWIKISVVCEAQKGRNQWNTFERGHPVVYYQICIIDYTPSIHNIHQTRCKITIRWFWLHVSAVTGHLQANYLAWRWPVTAETCSQISLNCNYYILFDVCCVLTVHNILHNVIQCNYGPDQCQMSSPPFQPPQMGSSGNWFCNLPNNFTAPRANLIPACRKLTITDTNFLKVCNSFKVS